MAVSNDLIIESIKKYHGNLSKVAAYIGMSRTTLYKRLNETDTIKEALENARNKRNDDVRDTLYKVAVEDENVTALIFIAKTQMGWKEVNKIEHDIGYHVTIDD